LGKFLLNLPVKSFRFVSGPANGCVWLSEPSSTVQKWARYNSKQFADPLRELQMGKKFHEIGVGLETIRCEMTDESPDFSRFKFDVKYLPDVGDQYWTIFMGKALMSLKSYLICQDPTTGAVVDAVFAMLETMKAHSVTHGHFTLDNILVVSLKPFTIKAINFRHSLEQRDDNFDAYFFIMTCQEDEDNDRIWDVQQRLCERYGLSFSSEGIKNRDGLVTSHDDVTAQLPLIGKKIEQESARQHGDVWCRNHDLEPPEGVFDTLWDLQVAAIQAWRNGQKLKASKGTKHKNAKKTVTNKKQRKKHQKKSEKKGKPRPRGEERRGRRSERT
jgi:hypothetical protein